jgi:hypothetical protein
LGRPQSALFSPAMFPFRRSCLPVPCTSRLSRRVGPKHVYEVGAESRPGRKSFPQRLGHLRRQWAHELTYCNSEDLADPASPATFRQLSERKLLVKFRPDVDPLRAIG